MANGKYVAYYRVSTARQGRSGLGLEAQQEEVERYLNGGDWTLLRSFTEVETGKSNKRPVLTEALRYAALTGATLIVAKLDRLSRNAAFLNTIFDSGRTVVFADMPHADRLMIGIMAQLAQWEAEQISKRTKAALKAVKARGVKLGGDRGMTHLSQPKAAVAAAEARSEASRERGASVMHFINEARAKGIQTYRGLAAYLNDQGIVTPRGKQWLPGSVQKVVARAE